MDKQQIGSLGLSPKSVQQLERVIDTADTLLYPAHLMIGGWRMFLAACVLAVILVCQAFWWVCDSLYHNGLINTVVSIVHMAGEFPWVTVLIGLPLVVLVFIILLPITRWFTAILQMLWFGICDACTRPRTPAGWISAAEILTKGARGIKGYDPKDFDWEEIDGFIYGKRRGM